MCFPLSLSLARRRVRKSLRKRTNSLSLSLSLRRRRRRRKMTPTAADDDRANNNNINTNDNKTCINENCKRTLALRNNGGRRNENEKPIRWRKSKGERGSVFFFFSRVFRGENFLFCEEYLNGSFALLSSK